MAARKPTLDELRAAPGRQLRIYRPRRDILNEFIDDELIARYRLDL